MVDRLCCGAAAGTGFLAAVAGGECRYGRGARGAPTAKALTVKAATSGVMFRVFPLVFMAASPSFAMPAASAAQPSRLCPRESMKQADVTEP
jgi:hypothetical protein